MSDKKHKKEVANLISLEDSLIKLISETDNEKLMDKFSEWQSQRNVCNKGFLKYVESLTSPPPIPSAGAKEIAEEAIKKYPIPPTIGVAESFAQAPQVSEEDIKTKASELLNKKLGTEFSGELERICSTYDAAITSMMVEFYYMCHPSAPTIGITDAKIDKQFPVILPTVMPEVIESNGNSINKRIGAKWYRDQNY